MNRAVFLDRDGTLIEEIGYLDRLDRVAFFPFSVDAVRLLNRAGFMVVIVTRHQDAGNTRGDGSTTNYKRVTNPTIHARAAAFSRRECRARVRHGR